MPPCVGDRLVCRSPICTQVWDLHTKRSPIQGGIHQTLYWYNWLSWCWARGCSKHVENRNKYTYKRKCASSWLLLIRMIPICTVTRTQNIKQNCCLLALAETRLTITSLQYHNTNCMLVNFMNSRTFNILIIPVMDLAQRVGIVPLCSRRFLRMELRCGHT